MMAILFYTTSISASITIGEIMQCLSEHKAKEITVTYDDEALPVGLCFSLVANGEKVFFQLPCRWEGVLTSLQNDPKVPKKLRTKEQAMRTCWRILLSWVKCQMALVEPGMATSTEVFFQYALTKGGETLFEKISGTDRNLLLT